MKNLKSGIWDEIRDKIKDMAEKNDPLIKTQNKWWDEECDKTFKCRMEPWKRLISTRGNVNSMPSE